jgi:hypothetical protein
MTGDIPPPCRAHTSTLVDRKLVVYGGGQGAHYYSDVFVLDTLARRWAKADFRGGTVPAPRRAHTAEYYRGRIYVFGGGNGTEAVNDVWALDVGAHAHADRMRWDKVAVSGPRPCARGYHTANVVGSVMVVIGGSDGKECFSDVWCLHLDALVWTPIKLELPYRRLSHTSTQIGSYLYVFGGHDGAGYKNELVLFNLSAASVPPFTRAADACAQRRSSTRRAPRTAAGPASAATTSRSSPTRVSSSSAASTATTSTTTCTASSLPRAATCPRSPASRWTSRARRSTQRRTRAREDEGWTGVYYVSFLLFMGCCVAKRCRPLASFHSHLRTCSPSY